jgi:hypothetical protein
LRGYFGLGMINTLLKYKRPVSAGCLLDIVLYFEDLTSVSANILTILAESVKPACFSDGVRRACDGRRCKSFAQGIYPFRKPIMQ